MRDLAKHIVNQKSGRFEPEKFEDQYQTGQAVEAFEEAAQRLRVARRKC
jgi:non-homologous end joining protein Ku